MQDSSSPASDGSNNARLRVCYFGTYRAEYSRNQIMIEGLRRAGVEVIECHEQFWYSIEDRVKAASGGWIKPSFWWRLLKVYLRLLRRFGNVKDFDILIVGYPGQFDVFLARVLSWIRRKPLVWDVFMSIYLIALERGLDKNSRWTVGILKRVEWLGLRLPDLLIQDTTEYVQWFGDTYKISTDRFRLVPTGADDRYYQPAINTAKSDGKFRVIYYGTFIPNHGVEYIVEAANLLSSDNSIEFEMIGSGPDRERAITLAQHYGLNNITFVEWLDKNELVQRVASADVCLGAFGKTPQSLMTVQNKVYEGLAMAKPVINGDSPAIQNVMEHERHIYLCNRKYAQSLVEAVIHLKNSPELCKYIAKEGNQLFNTKYGLHQLGKSYKQHLCQLFHQTY